LRYRRDVLRAEEASEMTDERAIRAARGFALLPAVAASRQIPEAEPNSDGAVAGTIGAIPIGETEAGGVSVATAFDGRLLVELVGAARGREAGGVRATVGSDSVIRSVESGRRACPAKLNHILGLAM